MRKQMASSGRALLIGIDQYASAPPLRGCVNDVQLMSSVLLRFGFGPANVERLLNSAATRQAILGALDGLSEEAGPEGTLFIHFSGWGLRIPREPSGSERIITGWAPPTREGYAVGMGWQVQSGYRQAGPAPGDEADRGLMSALVPHDWDGTPATSIGRELRDWLAQAAGQSVVLVVDAPYAGGLVEEGATASGQVFMAACRSGEICHEILAASKVYQGVFSYFLAQALLDAEPGATYGDVFSRVSQQVVARFAYQHPQLLGEAGLPLFAAGQPPAAHFVSVKKRERERVTLTVGAAQGATVGSRWAIYPRGRSKIGSAEARLGLVEITSVSATDSEARILSESGWEAIRPRANALEEAHNFGEMRLPVRVAAPPDNVRERDGLVKLLLASPLLRLADEDPAADTAVTVHLLGPRSGAAETDAVPQLQELTETTWAVVDRSSTLVLPPVPASGYSAPYLVRDGLENLARYRNVLGLRNPNPNSPLAGKVQFRILRLADGSWVPAEADPQGGLPVFGAGDRIGFEIVNDHSDPVWGVVLDFGLSTLVTMLYPPQGGSEPIRPGRSVKVGVRPGDEITLYLDDDFRREGSAPSRGAMRGIETLKLFATAYPTDLGMLLVQQGGRGLASSRGEATALWQLLDLALTGVGSRDLRPVQLPPEQEWTTVERAFELRPGR